MTSCVLVSAAPVLRELALLLGLCVLVAALFHRMKLPPIVGFVVAGALVGPNSLGLVHERELVDQLAEIGVVVLLFTVGLELSLVRVLRARRSVLLGGSVQVSATVVLGMVVGLAGGLPAGPAIFLGFLLSLSSTAAITKIMSDRGALGSPTGNLGIGICVAQDLAVVPMIVVLPLLGAGSEAMEAPVTQVLRTLLFLGIITVATWGILPHAIGAIARTRSRELFVLGVVTICFVVSLGTAQLGLSPALGAFIAGLVLGGSHYRHQAISEVGPFRDVLSSLFFVSIGMLFDYRVLLESPLLVCTALSAVVLGKALAVFLAAKLLRLPSWVGLRTAFLLAQVGEFSFVLVQAASGRSLLSAEMERTFLAVAVLSIALTPVLFAACIRATRGTAEAEPLQGEPQPESLDHVIVAGFGPAGQILAGALEETGIPFKVIEMNDATVMAYRAKGLPIMLGDVTRASVLRSAGIMGARLLVLTINDRAAIHRSVAQARILAPGIQILARAVYLADAPELTDLGVNEVVPQELEMSVEILARTLRQFLVADDEVDRQVGRVRDKAKMPRVAMPPKRQPLAVSEAVPGLGVELFRVEPSSSVAGKTLGELGLRQVTGCSVVALKTSEGVKTNIDADTCLMVEDVAVVIGPESRLHQVGTLLRQH